MSTVEIVLLKPNLISKNNYLQFVYKNYKKRKKRRIKKGSGNKKTNENFRSWKTSSKIRRATTVSNKTKHNFEK